MTRYFVLQRNEDISGNSGVGNVAEALWIEGVGAVLFWTAETNAMGVSSVVIYQSLDDLRKIHGHGGATVLVEKEYKIKDHLRLRARVQAEAERIILFDGRYVPIVSQGAEAS
jgi:hypothetical protein